MVAKTTYFLNNRWYAPSVRVTITIKMAQVFVQEPIASLIGNFIGKFHLSGWRFKCILFVFVGLINQHTIIFVDLWFKMINCENPSPLGCINFFLFSFFIWQYPCTSNLFSSFFDIAPFLISSCYEDVIKLQLIKLQMVCSILCWYSLLN